MFRSVEIEGSCDLGDLGEQDVLVNGDVKLNKVFGGYENSVVLKKVVFTIRRPIDREEVAQVIAFDHETGLDLLSGAADVEFRELLAKQAIKHHQEGREYERDAI